MRRENKTCQACAVINRFPHEFCCLNECGQHSFCINCEILIMNKECKCQIAERVKANKERYTIEQIIDAITQASYDILYAMQTQDREMLEDVLKDYLH